MADAGAPTPSRGAEGPALFAGELVAELLATRIIAAFATFDPDGSIHLVPMWFAREGPTVLLATSGRSRKIRNLERDPRASLMLHDSRPGFEVCGGTFTGRAIVIRGATAVPLVESVHRRYVRPEVKANATIGAFLESDDVAIRFTPERALTWDQRGNEATRQLAETAGAHPLLPTSPRGRSAGRRAGYDA